MRFLLLLLVFAVRTSWADYGVALGYEPKYKPGFTSFEYVRPDAPKGGSIAIGGQGSFDTLNPFVLKGDPADGTGLVFETLMTPSLDEPFSMYGLLADDMTVADDELSVTFRLNRKARFSDGQPVTAGDVKRSFQALMDKEARPQYRFYYADVEKVEVVDRLTVRFHFKNPNRELPLILGQLEVFSSKWGKGKTLGKIAMDTPLGSGPYVLERYDLGRNLYYRRNPRYWGAELPSRRGMFNFDRIVYRYYQDETARLEGFKAGEFDISHENSAKQWARNYNGVKFRDGTIVKRLLPDESPAGMQGFGFNLRKPLFKDIRVRQALALALDFEWSNRMLFYGQYTRSSSFFSNSEMEAQGKPAGAELALLNKHRSKLPASVFDSPPVAPSTAPPNSLRSNLRHARELLRQAGWTYRAGALRNRQGQAMQIEMLLVSKTFERIVAPYARNLQKLGVGLNYRVVDPSLFRKRMQRFDFDMTVVSFPMSISPGNELLEMLGSEAASIEDSRNLVGVADPGVDALVKEVIQAKDREALVIACRALDRVLRAGHLVVPHWHIANYRVAWWNKYAQPKTLPKYYSPTDWALSTWWAAPPSGKE